MNKYTEIIRMCIEQIEKDVVRTLVANLKE